jgi:hypothetical protein
VNQQVTAPLNQEPTTPLPKQGPFNRVWLRADLTSLVDSLQLAPEQDHFLRSRWLENVLWMETAAQRTRTRYYTLRLVTVIGAVIVPALVSINALGGTKEAVTWLTFSFSLVVAVSAAVEGFFRFGERWRHYRSLVEELKTEGWDFYELSGHYKRNDSSHAAAFPIFVSRVNNVLRRETQAYISEIASAPQAPGPSDGAAPADGSTVGKSADTGGSAAPHGATGSG